MWDAAVRAYSLPNSIGKLSIKRLYLQKCVPFCSGGNVNAAGKVGAGIGSANGIDKSKVETTNISGGRVTATGYNNAAGIGAGNYNSFDENNITGGGITATSGHNASGIGNGTSFDGDAGVITITGVDKMQFPDDSMGYKFGSATEGKELPKEITDAATSIRRRPISKIRPVPDRARPRPCAMIAVKCFPPTKSLPLTTTMGRGQWKRLLLVPRMVWSGESAAVAGAMLKSGSSSLSIMTGTTV